MHKSNLLKFFVTVVVLLVLLFIINLINISNQRYYPSLNTIVSFNHSLTQQGMTSSRNYTYSNGVINKSFQFSDIVKGAHNQIISTPTVVNGVAYFGDNNFYIYAVNAQTGKLVWKTKVNNEIMNQLLVVNGVVYFGTGNNLYKTSITNSSKLTSVNATGKNSVVRGSGNNGIYALSAKTGKVIWMKSTIGENMPSFAYKHGNLYVANGGKHFYSINAKTGTVNWVDNLKGYVSMSSINLNHNVAYFGEGLPNQTQYVAAINIRDKKILWQRAMPQSFGGLTDCSPSSNSKYVVISGEALSPTPNKFYEVLYVLSKKTGEIAWDHILGFGSNPMAMETANSIIVKNSIYVGNPIGKGRFYSFNINTGKMNWMTKVYGDVKDGAVYSHGILYFGDEFKNFYALNAKNGDVLGVHRFGVGKTAQFSGANPALVNNEIYIGSSDGILYAFPDTYVYKDTVGFVKYYVWSIFDKIFGFRI
ncbi:MAG: outer membrane protein assembly factor BamB family protein [Patescibacteria group bacterium]